MSKVKSTKSLGYALKGILNLEEMTVTESFEEEDDVVHDVREILEQFDLKEVTLAIGMKDKLE